MGWKLPMEKHLVHMWLFELNLGNDKWPSITARKESKVKRQVQSVN